MYTSFKHQPLKATMISTIYIQINNRCYLPVNHSDRKSGFFVYLRAIVANRKKGKESLALVAFLSVSGRRGWRVLWAE